MQTLNGHQTITARTPNGREVTLEYSGPTVYAHARGRLIAAAGSKQAALDIAEMLLEQYLPALAGFPLSDHTPDPTGFAQLHTGLRVRICKPRAREDGATGTIAHIDPAHGLALVDLDRVAAPLHGVYEPQHLVQTESRTRFTPDVITR